MKNYELQNLLLETLDENVNLLSEQELLIRNRKIRNIRTMLKTNVAIVVVNSKNLCLQLQENKFTIGNNSDETKDELIGFKLKNELTLSDICTFDFATTTNH